MPLLNYTTKIEADRTVSEITTILGKKGATEISTTYGSPGNPLGPQVDGKHQPRPQGIRTTGPG